jgi:hypothetical protein
VRLMISHALPAVRTQFLPVGANFLYPHPRAEDTVSRAANFRTVAAVAASLTNAKDPRILQTQKRSLAMV